MKKRSQMLSLIHCLMEVNKPKGATELRLCGVKIPLSSLYESLDKLIEREKNRPDDRKLFKVVHDEGRIATKYMLTTKGKEMGYWLAKRGTK